MVSTKSFDDQEAWKSSIIRAKNNSPELAGPLSAMLEGTSGNHQWTETNHPRPTFCNYCREKLNGVPWHGYTCDICKVKAHRKCREKIIDSCKWTTEASIPQHLQYISPENSIVPHQWVEGNLPMPAKCIVCEKPCGSVRKLTDWRCLWCACCVHSSCLSQLGRGCSLGPASLSVIPPLALKEVTQEGNVVLRTDAYGGECPGGSPLIVLINAKSGDSQGQRIIKKFRRLLNPCQVFDIITTGPEFALTFFSNLESFRVLVCGGDGTVGWVLGTFDRLNLHSKCQLAILPLGTGNDLARVLGWGHAFYDDTQLPQLVITLERAHTKMLDRWSVLSIEGAPADTLRLYEDLIIEKMKYFLEAEQSESIIKCAASLCTTIQNMIEEANRVFPVAPGCINQKTRGNDLMALNFSTVLAKTSELMTSIREEIEESGFEPGDEDECTTADEQITRSLLVRRANSLKKAFREVIAMAERGLDNHYKDNACTRRERFRKKRSKTTPSVLKASHSNLSTSSACTPPRSPTEKTIVATISPDEQEYTKEFRSASCKAAFDISFSQSTSSMVLNENFIQKHGKLPSPSIGTVHPPTPGGTREPSAAFDDDDEDIEIDGVESYIQARPSDRPRIYSDPNLSEEVCSGFSKLNPNIDKIKVSHSDSSLYGEHGSSSETGLRVSGSRLSTAKITERAAGKSKDSRRTTGSDLGLSCSSNLRSCRNMLCGFAGGSLIAEILLMNARLLSNRKSQHGVDCRIPFDEYKETCVMNNYFGIGLDAKIALEFHNKREESEKTRSRSKLFMWYGILGGKELMHRTYRNLEQRIKLECDGIPIDLPSLQGIVILNIPSYSGGANFWGRTKDDGFTVQSFDDRILEVVALFGVIHVATSRVPNAVRLQNHRIAQCRHVRIVILGDEPIPVQVDGEPRLQPPGILQIVHKNRAQMLARNPVFDATLKKWEEQKERSSTTAPSTPTALGSSFETVPFSRRASEFLRLVESEIARLGVSSAFLEALDSASMLVRSGDPTEGEDELAGDIEDREEVLAAVERVVELLEDHFGYPERAKAPIGHPRLGPAPRFTFEIHGDEPDNWRYVVHSIRQEMDREESALREIRHQDLVAGRPKRSRLSEWISKKFGSKSHVLKFDNITEWTVDQVCSWVSSIGLAEYSSQFKKNDIQGSELIHLERSDIHELGVTKIGHVKRLQSAIDELRARETANRRAQIRRDSRRAHTTRLNDNRLANETSTRLPKTASLSADRWSSVVEVGPKTFNPSHPELSLRDDPPSVNSL